MLNDRATVRLIDELGIRYTYMLKKTMVNFFTTLLLTAAVTVVFFLGMWFQRYTQPSLIHSVYRSDHDDAKGAVITFLGSLFQKNYTQAAAAYGGDYAQLRYWNPDTNPSDAAALWQRGCEQNGLQCLEIRNVAFSSQPNPDTYIFTVWFSQSDKITEFTGPDGKTAFPFTVIRDVDGEYSVMTMPVYTQ
jgi:hypothetical protein